MSVYVMFVYVESKWCAMFTTHSEEVACDWTWLYGPGIVMKYEVA